ncbi:hypothetical protein DSO57_1030962 [Entomophthora muscae]|uniref:Uncharacterized protein n=1 Tax=Entomophthora muscae TaxID=34485 RepID=A0ACC2ULK5_9FUNG|nr:hypothetical protein DSO57_1030962 [Entomophthora muscae]
MILDFAAEYAVQLTLILVSISVIVAFRYRILYTEYTYDDQRPDNWDKNISLGDYIEGLLANPRTRKKKLREYLVNDIYLTEIGGETISLKKMKPATTIFRIFIRAVSRFSLWFRHIEVLRPNDAFDFYTTEETKRFIENKTIFFEQNHVQVLIRTRDPNFNNLNEKLMDAILRNIPECEAKAVEISNERRLEVFEKIAKSVVQFLRGAGYLYTRKLVTKETNWDNAMFFWTVVAIGLNLDPVLFPVRIHLTQTSSSFTFPIPKPDLVIFEYRTNAFITVEQNAKSQLRVAKEKIKNARAKVQARLKKASSQPDSFERTDKLIESLAEENIVDALPPEAFARDSDIAQVFLKSIKTLIGLSINAALKHPLIITCNKFIKVSSKKNLSDFYTPLQRQITAMKLGLTPSHFDQNPGFEEFAKQTHLHRYLFVQGHELEVDSSNRILVMFEGRVLPWEEVLPKLQFENLSGVFSGQYSKEGFVNYGVYDWTEFEPFYIEKQLPPPWGDRYLCEVCSWIIDKPRIKGDHTFLRLKTPKGEWYSVGQYEPLKVGLPC